MIELKSLNLLFIEELASQVHIPVLKDLRVPLKQMNELLDDWLSASQKIVDLHLGRLLHIESS